MMLSSVSESNGATQNRHRPKKIFRMLEMMDAASAIDAVYRSDWGRIVNIFFARCRFRALPFDSLARMNE